MIGSPQDADGPKRLAIATGIAVLVYGALGFAVYRAPVTAASLPPESKRIEVKTFNKRIVLPQLKKPRPPPPPEPTPKPPSPPPERITETPAETKPAPMRRAEPKRPIVRRKRPRKRPRKRTPRAPKTVTLTHTTVSGPIRVHHGSQDVYGDPGVRKTPESTTPAPPAPETEEDAPPSTGTGKNKGQPAAKRPKLRPPKVLRKVTGRYPAKARGIGRTIRITLSLKLDKRGRVVRARIVNKPAITARLFDKEAIRVARTTRFSPALLGSKPIPFSLRYVVVFTP